MEYKKRKDHRIKWYDYASSGGYFITVCAQERKNHFWTEVGAPIGRPYDFKLSYYGLIVEQAINPNDEFDWGDVFISTAIGAAEGALTAMCPGAGVFISSAASATETLIDGIRDGDSVSEIATNTLISTVVGAAGGSGGNSFLKDLYKDFH